MLATPQGLQTVTLVQSPAIHPLEGHNIILLCLSRLLQRRRRTLACMLLHQGQHQVYRQQLGSMVTLQLLGILHLRAPLQTAMVLVHQQRMVTRQWQALVLLAATVPAQHQEVQVLGGHQVCAFGAGKEDR